MHFSLQVHDNVNDLYLSCLAEKSSFFRAQLYRTWRGKMHPASCLKPIISIYPINYEKTIFRLVACISIKECVFKRNPRIWTGAHRMFQEKNLISRTNHDEVVRLMVGGVKGNGGRRTTPKKRSTSALREQTTSLATKQIIYLWQHHHQKEH